MKRWQVLMALGLLGVASLALAPFEQFLPGMPTAQARALALLQPALLTLLAVAIGSRLAPTVGLRAPLVDALIEGRGAAAVLWRQLPLAILFGLLSAAVLVLYATEVMPLVGRSSPEALAKLKAFSIPLPSRILYGGLTEELLTRWGLVSLFAWAFWRLGGGGEVRSGIYWSAIALAALLFAAGHLPLLFALVKEPPAWLTATILAANAVPGLLCGWLFWRRGIEAAMIAHALAHAFSAPFLS
jgi:membrane protease YdiL (CAAX protease family)